MISLKMTKNTQHLEDAIWDSHSIEHSGLVALLSKFHALVSVQLQSEDPHTYFTGLLMQMKLADNEDMVLGRTSLQGPANG